MLTRGLAVLCTIWASLLIAPTSGASQDWTATSMQAARESGVPAKRRETMLATKKGGSTRLAVMHLRGGEFSPPGVAGDCYKVVEAATDTSEKARAPFCTLQGTLNVPPHSAAHATLSTAQLAHTVQ